MAIRFTQPIRHGKDRLHTALLTPRRRLPKIWGLSIATFNICDNQGFRLEQAIQAVHIGGFDLMILTATNITDQAYGHNMLGYDVVYLPVFTTDAGGLKRGVGLVVRDQPQGWSIELMRFQGLKVVRFEVVASGKRNLLIDM